MEILIVYVMLLEGDKATRGNLNQNIENLENDILQIENKITKFSETNQNSKVKSSIKQLRTDLKYLAILANDSKIDANQHKKFMEFLTTHYNYLQQKFAYSNTLTG